METVSILHISKLVAKLHLVIRIVVNLYLMAHWVYQSKLQLETLKLPVSANE